MDVGRGLVTGVRSKRNVSIGFSDKETTTWTTWTKQGTERPSLQKEETRIEGLRVDSPCPACDTARHLSLRPSPALHAQRKGFRHHVHMLECTSRARLAIGCPGASAAVRLPSCGLTQLLQIQRPRSFCSSEHIPPTSAAKHRRLPLREHREAVLEGIIKTISATCFGLKTS